VSDIIPISEGDNIQNVFNFVYSSQVISKENPIKLKASKILIPGYTLYVTSSNPQSLSVVSMCIYSNRSWEDDTVEYFSLDEKFKIIDDCVFVESFNKKLVKLFQKGAELVFLCNNYSTDGEWWDDSYEQRIKLSENSDYFEIALPRTIEFCRKNVTFRNEKGIPPEYMELYNKLPPEQKESLLQGFKQ